MVRKYDGTDDRALSLLKSGEDVVVRCEPDGLSTVDLGGVEILDGEYSYTMLKEGETDAEVITESRFRGIVNLSDPEVSIIPKENSLYA